MSKEKYNANLEAAKGWLLKHQKVCITFNNYNYERRLCIF